jgi:hypothetical protein
LKALIRGHLSYCALLSQLHQGLVHSDANQPGHRTAAKRAGIFPHWLCGELEPHRQRRLSPFSQHPRRSRHRRGRAAEPLNELTAPHGVHFVAGNPEQFGDDSKYLRAIEAAGVRVLSNEKVEVAGLQIIGVPYRNATQEGRVASALHGIHLDRDRAGADQHLPQLQQSREASRPGVR